MYDRGREHISLVSFHDEEDSIAIVPTKSSYADK